MPLFAQMLHTAMTLWQRYDVQKFTAVAIICLREIQYKQNLMF